MATNRPIAVANKASAIPGATIARLVLPESAILKTIHNTPNCSK